MEELGAGDGSVALTIAAHNSLSIGHLLIAANEEQKARWAFRARPRRIPGVLGTH